MPRKCLPTESPMPEGCDAGSLRTAAAAAPLPRAFPAPTSTGPTVAKLSPPLPLGTGLRPPRPRCQMLPSFALAPPEAHASDSASDNPAPSVTEWLLRGQ